MGDQINMILAIVLSAVVLFGWNYFFGMPQMQKQREQAEQQKQVQQQATPGTPSTTPGVTTPTPGADTGQLTAPQAGAPASPTGQVQTRDAVLAAGPRIAIDTPAVKGSIALKG